LFEPAPIYNYLFTSYLLPQPRRLSSKDDARAGATVEVERVVPEREERLLVERLSVDVRRHMLCADEVRDDHELLVEALDRHGDPLEVPRLGRGAVLDDDVAHRLVVTEQGGGASDAVAEAFEPSGGHARRRCEPLEPACCRWAAGCQALANPSTAPPAHSRRCSGARAWPPLRAGRWGGVS